MNQESIPSNPHTRGVAEFIASLRYEDIPPEVLSRAKLLILDSLGCAIYAADLEWSQILLNRIAELDDTRTCTVWGTSHKLSAPHAALVNGSLVQGFEIDDVHRAGILHVGATVLPALLPIAETRAGMTGKEFLTSAIAGYEVGPRVGICMGTGVFAQGWHTGAIFGVFSAVAGAARGLRLSTDKAVHALGIAGTQSSGLIAVQYGAMVKRMHAGRASQSGLYGAQLADAGYTGIMDVFESEYGGFCTTFSNSKDRFKLEELTSGFRTTWQTMGVGLKFYSCVYPNHQTLDAIKDMQHEHRFDRKDIEKIIVYGSQTTVDHVGWKYVPQGMTSAQLNLSYCIATMLIEGECFVDQFTEARLTDPERMALAAKVEMRHDPAITAKGKNFRHLQRVELYLKNGAKIEALAEAPRGSEKKFATDEEIVAKFRNLGSRVLPSSQIEQLIDATLGLEKLPDAARIAQLMQRR